jgi:hypothetical protein
VLLVGGFFATIFPNSGVYTRKKKPIPEEQKPLWEQDFIKTFVRVEPVPDDVTELFPKIISYMDNLKTSAYKNLVNVNFQQYDITSYLNKAPQGR